MPTSIPAKFHTFFWDVDAKKINPAEKNLFIIQRLLDKGDSESVSWILQNYDHETIKKAFTSLRDFSPKVALYWQKYLNINIKDMPSLQEDYLRVQKSHWPFGY